jgi:hypothetical protein
LSEGGKFWNCPVFCVVKGDTLLALAFCPLLLLSDCTTARNLRSVPAGSFEAQLDEACGKPIVYPLSPKCIKLMGGVGPALRHRSDLVMRIWRTCPDENPCNKIVRSNPACTGQGAAGSVTAVSDSGAGTKDPCQRAQEADYSCLALREDLAYRNSPGQAPDPEDNCAANKNRLDEFDQKIEDMSVHIQWYRVFAGQGF